MSNPDRGAYEPTYDDEDVDTFDATDEEEEESTGRSPVLIILGLLVLAGFGAVVWMAYNQGLKQGVRNEVPTLVAEDGPIKVQPDNPGGTTTAHTDKLVYEGVNGTGTPKAEQLLPPTEQPRTLPPATTTPPVSTTTTTGLGTPARPTATTDTSTPATTTTQPSATTAVPPPLTGDQIASAQPPSRPATTTTTPPATTTPDETTSAATLPPVTSTQAPPTSATSTPKPPAAATTTTTTPPVATTTQPKPPAAVATISPIDAATVPAATARPPSAGAFVVQVGSYPNDGAAAGAWQTIKGKNVALLSNYKPDVKPADLGGKGTWYRLRIGPFDTREAASELCGKLKAGGQDCIVAKP